VGLLDWCHVVVNLTPECGSIGPLASLYEESVEMNELPLLAPADSLHSEGSETMIGGAAVAVHAEPSLVVFVERTAGCIFVRTSLEPLSFRRRELKIPTIIPAVDAELHTILSVCPQRERCVGSGKLVALALADVIASLALVFEPDIVFAWHSSTFPFSTYLPSTYIISNLHNLSIY